MRRCLLSVVAVVATYLVGLRLLLPDRVRMPILRRSNASTFAPISPRKCLFARRAFNSPLSHRYTCKVHHTSLGIFSSISELDDAIATCMPELLLLLLLLILLIAVLVMAVPPSCAVVAQAERLGDGTLQTAQLSTHTLMFSSVKLHTCGDEPTFRGNTLPCTQFSQRPQTPCLRRFVRDLASRCVALSGFASRDRSQGVPPPPSHQMLPSL